jgi:hypothetical protein
MPETGEDKSISCTTCVSWRTVKLDQHDTSKLDGSVRGVNKKRERATKKINHHHYSTHACHITLLFLHLFFFLT